jgi:hypothetical protein
MYEVGADLKAAGEHSPSLERQAIWRLNFFSTSTLQDFNTSVRPDSSTKRLMNIHDDPSLTFTSHLSPLTTLHSGASRQRCRLVHR